MNIFLPDTIKKLINIFNQNNFKCFIVGGAIRDMLLNISPKEFDLCTSTNPKDIKHMFKKFIDRGEAHGCIKVYFENNWYEITSFRFENSYKDFRHPEFITLLSSHEFDSIRRDFTINSLYFDGKIFIDMFNGKRDLENKLIRLIGNKNLKLREDPLRILRGLKLKSKLNFNFEFETLLSIKNNFHLITKLTKFRIHDELSEIFSNKYFLPPLKIFISLNGFSLILNREIKFLNIDKLLKIPNKFHLKLFCLLYFHSNLNKETLIEVLTENFNFKKLEMNEIKILFSILKHNILNPNSILIKELILKFNYETTFNICSILNTYFNFKIDKFFKIKWGKAPIKVSHLNIRAYDFVSNKKKVNKYNSYLITLCHKYPRLNNQKSLKHLIKNAPIK